MVREKSCTFVDIVRKIKHNNIIPFKFIIKRMSQKRVYLFGNGKAEGNAKMREELGGKGANLAEKIGRAHV